MPKDSKKQPSETKNTKPFYGLRYLYSSLSQTLQQLNQINQTSKTLAEQALAEHQAGEAADENSTASSVYKSSKGST